ncbi:hypothetical protein [Radiobacillus deserti]|uniref:Glycoside transferase n=1 Tax=Radiobacillus deserti TaxID=2594883 RepID=A0A516KI77_9BACI|nr:hypothetical protein [Radiobacillus deserti]QDP41105.1 hypothetical protein FN924_13435 [Radiobacillus deserti]
MIKKLILMTMIATLSLIVVFFFVPKKDPYAEEVKAIIQEHYVNEEGWIRNYGGLADAQYLSESIGQYMYFLLVTKDEEEFAKQVDVLKEDYVVEQGGQLFLKWQLTEDTTTNASVDDLRVIESLKGASKQFLNDSYIKLANELQTTLLDTQTNKGMVVDYYDWNADQKSTIFHLSYINHDVLKDVSSIDEASYKQVMEDSILKKPFFREIYDVEKQEFMEASPSTINMIDQLLIAIQYYKIIGSPPTSFDHWLKQELDVTGKLFGGYQKETLQKSVAYESSSVYALALLYFLETDNDKYADQVHALLVQQPPFQKNPNYNEIHFFDFMYARLADVLYKQQ